MESNFSNNLKELREEKNITQKQLAVVLNTTVKTISHWETGYSEPSIKQIIDLAQFFSVSIEELLC
ncbi:MAG: helix-turn-helix transcriptional regulator [Candidatus Fimimonas sp.]